MRDAKSHRLKRILLIEDEFAYFDQMISTLEREGYWVRHVSNYQDALEELTWHFYHVVIADLHLHGYRLDQKLGEGHQILDVISSSPLNNTLTRIAITQDQRREVEGDLFRKYGVYEVINKIGESREDNYLPKLVEALKRAFDPLLTEEQRTRSRIGSSNKFDLEFDEECDLDVIRPIVEHIIKEENGKLRPYAQNKLLVGDDKQRDSDLVQLLELEVYDLMGRLFHDFASVYLSKMTGGLTGAGIIRAMPSNENDGVGLRYIVKVGRRDKLEREFTNYTKWVAPKFVGGAVTAASFAVSNNLAAILYRFAENDNGAELHEFDVLYQDMTKSAELVANSLRVMFSRTFRLLHGMKRIAKNASIVDDYYKSLELVDKGKSQRIVDVIQGKAEDIGLATYVPEYDPQARYFSTPLLKGQLLNPIAWLATRKSWCVLPISRCVTHGDLTGRNMMADTALMHVERNREVTSDDLQYYKLWLIDFYRTNESHILRDHVILETDIKYRLCEKLSLTEFLQLERILLNIDLPARQTGTYSKDMLRALTIVQHIRQLASELQGKQPDDEIEYLLALLMTTLNVLRLGHIDPLRRVYALISASLICSRIENIKTGNRNFPHVELASNDGLALAHESQEFELTFEHRYLLIEIMKRNIVLFVGRRSEDPRYPTPYRLMVSLMGIKGFHMTPQDNHRTMSTIYLRRENSREDLISEHLRYYATTPKPSIFAKIPLFPWLAIFTTNQHTYLEDSYPFPVVLTNQDTTKKLSSELTPIYKIYGTASHHSKDFPVTEQDYNQAATRAWLTSCQNTLQDYLRAGKELLLLYPSSSDIREIQSWKEVLDGGQNLIIWVVGRHLPEIDVVRMSDANIRHLNIEPEQLLDLLDHAQKNYLSPKLVSTEVQKEEHQMSFEYDIAISCAGEDSDYVDNVAECLRSSGVKVFYYKFEDIQVDLWGRDLYTHLDDIYRKKARYCVMFLSKHYAEKVWTNHERRSAQAKAFEESREYILPVRFDNTDIPGVPPTIVYVDANSLTPEHLCNRIIVKLNSGSTSSVK